MISLNNPSTILMKKVIELLAFLKRRSGLLITLGLIAIAAVLITVLVNSQQQVNSANQFNQTQTSKEAALPPVVVSAPSNKPSLDESSSASSTSHQQETQVVPDSPIIVSSSPSAVTSRSSTSAKPSASPSTESAILPVEAAPPTELSVSTDNHDLSLTVKVGSMPYNQALAAPSCTYSTDPECPEKAYWVRDTMGVAPSSSTDNSTYIVGHSWTQSPRVFDKLSDYGMTHYEVDQNGKPVRTNMASVFDPSGKTRSIETWKVPGLIATTATLKSQKGTLTYRVEQAFVTKKVDLGFVYAFQHGSPNTLVIETCGVDLKNRVDTDYDVVVIAKLVASRPAQ